MSKHLTARWRRRHAMMARQGSAIAVQTQGHQRGALDFQSN